MLLVTDRLFGGALGMGDVKLAVSLGLMLGVSRLLAGFLVASVAGAVVLLVLIGLRRLSLKSAVPFGPVLIGAGVIGALLPKAAVSGGRPRSGRAIAPLGTAARGPASARWCARLPHPAVTRPMLRRTRTISGRRAPRRGWCNRRSRE